MFICLLKIKTFGHAIKYSNILFHYDIVLDIHLYRLSSVCQLDPGVHMRCIWFLLKTGCDRLEANVQELTMVQQTNDNKDVALIRTHHRRRTRVYSKEVCIRQGTSKGNTTTLALLVDFSSRHSLTYSTK
jgi:hypothetical protein